MVSQSKSSINIALCLTAMLTTASTTQAQLSNIPTRYRTKFDYRPQEFGRKQHQQRGQQQQQNPKKTNLRELEGDLPIPIQESELDVPWGSSVRLMSIPLQESGFDPTMPLQESGFVLSMPTGDNPTQVHVDDMEDITLGKGGNSDGKTPILASFLAGISALAVGAAIFFVKKQQKHGSQVEESQQEREEMQMREGSLSSDAQMREVSFASHYDLNDMKREGRGQLEESQEREDNMRVICFAASDDLDDIEGGGREIVII